MMFSTDLNSAASGRSSDPDAAWIDNRVAQRLFGAGHRRIGRYRVLGVLGSGGMGLVYLATDDQLQRQVALKLLNARSHTPEGVERLLREARAMARLSHPRVVQVYEAGVHDGHIFIVMEYVAGSTLAEWPFAPGRPWRAVRDAFVAIAQGICAAHAVGIVHRDLKPSNILVDQHGRPKVADFGLARTEQEGITEPVLDTQPPPAGPLAPELTLSGVAVGTPRYMAPEQQHTQITSFASDQYSFCLLMWEMLYQGHPFEAPDAEAMLAAKLAGKVHPRPRHTTVPIRIHRALLRGLQAVPSTRWPSMIELLDQLERDPWPRRHPWLTLLAAALVAPAIFTAQLLSREPPGKSCTASALHRSDTVWNQSVRAALLERFAEGHLEGGGAATGELLSRGIDVYTDQWEQAQQELCISAAHPEAPREESQLVVRRTQCLEDRFVSLQSFLDALQSTPAEPSTSGVSAQALDPGAQPIELVPMLDVKLRFPAIDACMRTTGPGQVILGESGTPATVAVIHAHTRALAELQALEALNHHELARTQLAELLPQLRKDGLVELLPESEYLYGRLLRRLGRNIEAQEALFRAEQLAEQAWRDDLLVAVRLDLARLFLTDRATLGTHERRAQPALAEREYGRAAAVFARNGGDASRAREFVEVATLIAERKGKGMDTNRLIDQLLALGNADLLAPALNVQFLGQLANQYELSGELEQASKLDIDVLQRALSVLGEDHPLTVSVAYNAAGRLFKRGSHADGQEVLDIVLDADLRQHAEYMAASLLFHVGESEDAWPHAARAATAALESENPLQVAIVLHLQTQVQLRRGNYQAAQQAATEALAALGGCRPGLATRQLRWQLEVDLIEVLIYQLRGAEALYRVELLRSDIAAANEPASDGLEASIHLAEAQALVLVGRDDDAVRALAPGNDHAQVCDKLVDKLKVGDLHALIAQVNRAHHLIQRADRNGRIAVHKYLSAGRDGAARMVTGTPWSRPLNQEGSPI